MNVRRFFLLRSARLGALRIEHCRGKKTGDGNESYTSLFKPVPLKQTSDDINVGAELSGTLSKTEVQKILEKFRLQKDVETLSLEYGLDCKRKNNTFFFGINSPYSEIIN